MIIPKYKRDSFTFISNLKEFTASKEFPIALNRNGYLLSEYYTNTFYEELAKWVKQRRNLLISDNGNFSRMQDAAKDFVSESEELLNKLKNNEISKADGALKRNHLFNKIATHCEVLLKEQQKDDIIKNQLRINPDYLIALEDLTIPVLMICGLFDPVFEPKAIEIQKFQQNSRELYNKQRDGNFGNKELLDAVHKFYVMHSYDFSSAKQAALGIQDFSPEGIAISFGGAMSSRRWITEWNLESSVPLPENLPEMYFAAAAISLGYLDGHTQDTPVHILGIGSPILIALLGFLFGKSRAVSIDSTAPFKDAFQSKLYGARYGFLKMDMYKVAAYALIDNEPFSESTPYFKDFEKVFPHNWSKLRSDLGVSSSTDVRELIQVLEQETAMVEEHIPFFAKMRSGDDPLIKHLRIARAGHNYWILHRICNSVKQRKNNLSQLSKWMEYHVNRYKKYADPKWAKTIEIIYNEAAGRIL